MSACLESVIDRVTVLSYLGTEYRLYDASSTTLKVGVANPALAAIHAAAGVESSAFITAYNPFSRMKSAENNTDRQLALAGELKQRKLKVIDGVGQHPSNRWPGEPSFLVLGIALEDARALGQRWEQNAIIWSGSDAVPQLILLK